jgi:hypothetical protein
MRFVPSARFFTQPWSERTLRWRLTVDCGQLEGAHEIGHAEFAALEQTKQTEPRRIPEGPEAPMSASSGWPISSIR